MLPWLARFALRWLVSTTCCVRKDVVRVGKDRSASVSSNYVASVAIDKQGLGILKTSAYGCLLCHQTES